MNVTSKKRPWRLIKSWGADDFEVLGYFDNKQRAAAARKEWQSRTLWSEASLCIERWNGSEWEAVEDE